MSRGKFHQPKRESDQIQYINHSHRRSDVFGDARFWFCPNL